MKRSKSFAAGVLTVCIVASASSVPARGLSLFAAPQTGASSKPMTNVDVMELVKTGLPEDLVVAAIRNAPVKNFDTSVNGLKALSDAKVPKDVIRFMITGKEVAPPPSPGSREGVTVGPAGSPLEAKFKPGLWDVLTVSTYSSGITGGGESKNEDKSQVCRDERLSVARIGEMMMKGMGQAGCVPSSEHPDPGTVVVTMKCTQQLGSPTGRGMRGSSGMSGSMSSTTKTTLRQIDEEHTQMVMETKAQGSVAGRDMSSNMTGTTDMTWKGDCPANMRPGDERRSDGTIVHMDENGRPAMPR